MSLLVDIEKDFGSLQLKVSFETGGGALGLLGASGCGKSMTLKCIAGIVTPDRGRSCLTTHPLRPGTGHRPAPPEAAGGLPLPKLRPLPPYDSGAEYPRRDGPLPPPGGTAEQAGGASGSSLPDRSGRRRPAQLSGGQQQRAALGRILASEPAVLLLTSLSALDSYLKWQVELELMEVLDQFHGPTLFVTHSRDEVYHFCQTVCVLEHGRSQPVETVEQLFSAPETLSACLLSGCKNVSRARPAGRTWWRPWTGGSRSAAAVLCRRDSPTSGCGPTFSAPRRSLDPMPSPAGCCGSSTMCSPPWSCSPPRQNWLLPSPAGAGQGSLVRSWDP